MGSSPSRQANLEELVSQLERKQRKTSHFIGVSLHTASSAWRCQLWDPVAKRKRQIGSYASEVEAAWAHDVAALKQNPGVPDNKLNLPIQCRFESFSKLTSESVRSNSFEAGIGTWTACGPANQVDPSKSVMKDMSMHKFKHDSDCWGLDKFVELPALKGAAAGFL
ncbi:hypothetical protein FOA52_004643 [Chlamydomonas sp. UWO 241]|nr:hypothetical protein FOA52_004643 [Chlamydomonas sp. UWO 241]